MTLEKSRMPAEKSGLTRGLSFSLTDDAATVPVTDSTPQDSSPSGAVIGLIGKAWVSTHCRPAVLLPLYSRACRFAVILPLLAKRDRAPLLLATTPTRPRHLSCIFPVSHWTLSSTLFSPLALDIDEVYYTLTLLYISDFPVVPVLLCAYQYQLIRFFGHCLPAALEPPDSTTRDMR